MIWFARRQFVSRAIALEAMLDQDVAAREQIERRVDRRPRDFIAARVHVDVEFVGGKVPI